jgi:predicted secreted protein
MLRTSTNQISEPHLAPYLNTACLLGVERAHGDDGLMAFALSPANWAVAAVDDVARHTGRTAEQDIDRYETEIMAAREPRWAWQGGRVPRGRRPPSVGASVLLEGYGGVRVFAFAVTCVADRRARGPQRWSGASATGADGAEVAGEHSAGAGSASSRGRWRQLGDFPWASAWMRCFIVGGSDLAWDQDQGDNVIGAVAGAVRSPALLRVVSVCGTAAAAVVVTSPSAVNSARKAVTRTFHSFMTVFRAMAPHFRVGRFAYFPHDVYAAREVVDRRPWRVDVPMNTTRMAARGRKRHKRREEG